jgi:hypothetical protein
MSPAASAAGLQIMVNGGVVYTVRPAPDTPLLYGAWEPASVAPAIANAIFDATAARVRTVPFAPERFRAALARRMS